MMQGGPRDRASLPSCPLSKHYLQYLDLLDSPYFLHHSEQFPAEENDGEQRMLERLRTHLPACPTCTAIVRQARWLRSQQRSALQDVLLANEQHMPSTVVAIMEAIRQEPRLLPHSFQRRFTDEFPIIEIGQFRKPAAQAQRSPSRSYTLLRNILSMTAVIVLILAASVLFNHLLLYRTISTTASYSQPNFTDEWRSVVIGRDMSGRMSIENYDPYTGRHLPLVPLFSATHSTIDSVSHDGHNILYHYSSSGHTYYATLAPRPQTGYFYSLQEDNAGPTIWMGDSRHVLIATHNQGILEVDSQTGDARTVAMVLHVNHLWFYRDGYLYFNYTAENSPFNLWRVNIATGNVELVIKTSNGRSYFLSPDGTTVFYVDTMGTSRKTAIYTTNVSSLTESSHLLLSSAAIPVGFALDNTLELVQEVHQTFQIVKLKPTQAAIERVVMADIAPGAVALCDSVPTNAMPTCDENIALAPYGSGVIVTALKKDGTRQIWADDLTTGRTLLLQTISSSDTTHVQLPGWDRIHAQLPLPRPIHSPICISRRTR